MNILNKISFILFFLLLPAVGFCVTPPSTEAVRTVVLDPGHGGADPGAAYGGVLEKNITLAVALKLGQIINEKYPDINVVYTRKSDVSVALDKRGKIANDARANLFISIHVNASKQSSASGVETFVMGYDKSEKNLSVAMRENEVITSEENYGAKYEGFDPNSAESYIIFSLMQDTYLDKSLQFASSVQNSYTRVIPTPNRGVKQAGFLVLWRAAMPSVLTEIGFLSNERERSILNSSRGQQCVAESLFDAFAAYKASLEGRVIPAPLASKYNESIADAPAKTTTVATSNASRKEVKNNNETTSRQDRQLGEGERLSAEELAKLGSAAARHSDIIANSNSSTNINSGNSFDAGARIITEEEPNDNGETAYSSLSGSNISSEKEAAASVSRFAPQREQQNSARGGNIKFAVQVAASNTPITINSKNFGKYAGSVYQKKIGQKYKYFVGEVFFHKEALSLQRELKKILFKDAFVVAFRGGEIIGVNEALSALKNR